MRSLLQDVRYSARQLVRNPSFTVPAVLTLALGIGVNTAIFSIVNSVVLRPMDFPDPHELVVAAHTAAPQRPGPVSYADFLDWSERTASFQSVAAFTGGGIVFDTPDGPEMIPGMRVSVGFFRTLGARLSLGRDFPAEDDVAGAQPVVIVSHSFWANRLGGESSAIGRTIVLNAKAHTVVGVLPAAFRNPFAAGTREMLYTPLDAASTGMTGREAAWLTLVARLKPGVALRQAAAEVEAISRAAVPDWVKGQRKAGITLLLLQEQVAGMVGGLLWLLLTVVGFILLIACANLIGLHLSRNLARQTELAVRTALGAGGTRLVALLTTETLLVAAAGGVLGLLLGVWIADAIRIALPVPVPRLEEIALDWRVFLFTGAVAVLCGLVGGILPALRACRLDLDSMLRHLPLPGRTRPARLRSLFAVAQVAAATLLLAGAGLMVRSLIRMVNVDTGFAREGILKTDVWLQGNLSKERRAQIFREMQDRVLDVERVRAAGVVDMLPLGQFTSTTSMPVERLAGGVRPELAGQVVSFEQRTADEAYFRAMSIPLLQGRLFRPGDERRETMGVIISENMARHLWGEADPLGRRINSGTQKEWATVIGVVGAVRQRSLTAEHSLTLYRPLGAVVPSTASIVVRTEGDPALLAPTLRDLIREVDRGALVLNTYTMAELYARSAAVPRFLTLLLSSFALLGLAMAVVGLFGVMSYLVVQRTREFGVRLALGAQRSDILRLVLRRGVLMVGTGLLFGLGGAWGLTRYMRSLLYTVEPTDALTYAAVAAAMALVALAACYIPARRATRVDPMIALRHE